MGDALLNEPLVPMKLPAIPSVEVVEYRANCDNKSCQYCCGSIAVLIF
jgi:hypothetical protein